jgi:hypothetical protein
MKKSIPVVLTMIISLFFVASIYAGNAVKTPDILTLGSLTEKYEPVMFTHSRHVTLAGDCGKCHHEHGNFGSLPCKDCHSLAPSAFKSSVTRNFMACKNCHSTPSPDNPRIPGLKVAYHTQCFQCHRGMGNVGTDPKGCTEICHAKKEVKVSKK